MLGGCAVADARMPLANLTCPFKPSPGGRDARLAALFGTHEWYPRTFFL
jgi:hypothetical protein